MNILSPSILAADFCNLGNEIRQLEKEKVSWLHIDVMDGLFVPAISYGMPVLRNVRSHTEMFLDVHLMIDRPERYLERFAECGADQINFHIEATEQVEENIRIIRSLGKKVAVTIKPDTPAKAVEPYLELVDMVLVMTVEPGRGGQTIIPKCLDKVREVRAMAEARGLTLDIEVDGGIRIGNVEEALNAGANVIVTGTAVFRGNIEDNVQAFMKKLGR